MAFKHAYCSLYEEFGCDEIEVAEILLGFSRLVAISKYGSRLPFSWGGTRRRSVEANLGPRRAVHPPSTSASPSPSPSPSPILSVPMVPAITTTPAAAASSEPQGPITVKAEPATSPTTPLSVSPSESDERPKRLKRKVYTKKVCSLKLCFFDCPFQPTPLCLDMIRCTFLLIFSVDGF